MTGPGGDTGPAILPFTGFTVVERAGSVGGAYCGKLLAELGARVIKVEPPGGDPNRGEGPLLAAPADYGALFLYCNQRKQSVTVDDRVTSGGEFLWALLDRADALISDAPPSELGRLRLTPEEAVLRWPALVFASIRPYGLTGPLAEVAARELDVFHAGGEGKLLPGGLGFRMFPDRPPVKAGRHLAGYDAGVTAAGLIAAALLNREATGRGEVIDLSEQEVEIGLNRMNLDAQLNAGMALTRAHRGYDFGGIFPCRDGYVTVRPNEDRHWVGLARGLGREDLVEDPRFARREGRQNNAEPLNAILQEFFSGHGMLEIYDRLGRHGTPVGYFADAQALHESAQFEAREFFLPTDVDGTELRLPRAAYRMTQTDALPPARAPRRGEHTLEVRAEMGAAPPPKSTGRGQADPGAGAGPLAGLRIVDTSWAAAGPYATELAAMLGAEVIKVETSLYPDLFRRLVDKPGGGLDVSSRFNALNMSKKGLRLNLRTASGREAFGRLIAVSDGFIENYRPGVVERLGIAYSDLIKLRPDLVMVSISAAGQGGPHAGHPGYASIFNAMAGLGHLTGYRDGPPTEVRDSMDLRVASVAAFALTAALLHRSRGGRGQWIDVSAREAIASLIGDALVEYAVTGVSPHRDGNRQGSAAPYGVFRSQGEDAWVAIGVGTDPEWAGLCRAMDRPELQADHRFADRLLRHQHVDALEAAVEAWTVGLAPADAAARCRAAGVPASEVLGGRELVCDPQVVARQVVQEVDHPRLGPQRVVRGPWRLRSGERRLEPSPLLGQHNQEILRDLLGYDEAAIEHMRSAGAFE